MKEEIDLSMVCRICLQDTDEEMASLFDNDGTYCVYEQIEKCANIKITEDPNMPTRICSKCKVFLSFAFKFYIMCQNSQNYLEEFGQKSHEAFENVEDFEDETIELPEVEETEVECTTDDKIWVQIDHDHDDELIEVENAADYESAEDAISPAVSVPKHKPKKTLDISSDGTAVIRVKKPVNRNQNKNQLHVCDICGNIYRKKYMLETHMRHHRNEKPYECEICGGKYAYNFQLRRHMNKHTGARPHACSYCKRTFTDNSTMRKHERLHRNERPYKCDVCEKTFTYSSVLKAHQQIHTGEKPYICGICGKRFSRGHHLRAHLETQLHAKDPHAQILLKQIRPDSHFATETV